MFHFQVMVLVTLWFHLVQCRPEPIAKPYPVALPKPFPVALPEPSPRPLPEPFAKRKCKKKRKKKCDDDCDCCDSGCSEGDDSKGKNSEVIDFNCYGECLGPASPCNKCDDCECYCCKGKKKCRYKKKKKKRCKKKYCCC